MATSSEAEAAALERVDAAETQLDVAAVTREFAALRSSELVVARCCEALRNAEIAPAAAASADELLPLVLEALRRHAGCTPVVSAAWRVLEALVTKVAVVAPAVTHDALKLVHGTLKEALGTVLDTPAGTEMVKLSLAIYFRLAWPNHASRAVQLGGVEVAVQAMRRFHAHAHIQLFACGIVALVFNVPGYAVQRVPDELALSALRVHRPHARVCSNVSLLLYPLCCDEARAIKAKQLGAPAPLQAALKAHRSDEGVQDNASLALSRIQRFIDAACMRAEANMANLIAGEEAAKGGKSTAAAPKKAGKGKGKIGDGASAGLPPPPSPPLVAAGDVAVLTKAQIKRRKARAAAAARKAAAASGSAAGEEEEEEEEEEGSDTSSDDSEPFRPRRPPLDFSADGEFRRSMHLPRRPGIEEEIDKMVAESEARHAAKLAAAAAMPLTTRNAEGEKEGADTSDGSPFSLRRAAAPAPAPVPAPPTPAAAALSHAAAQATDPPAAAAVAAADKTSLETAFTALSSHDVVAPSPAPVVAPARAAPPVGPSREADLAAENEALRAENAMLRTTVAEAENAKNAALLAELAGLRARVAVLEAKPSSIQQ